MSVLCLTLSVLFGCALVHHVSLWILTVSFYLVLLVFTCWIFRNCWTSVCFQHILDSVLLLDLFFYLWNVLSTIGSHLCWNVEKTKQQEPLTLRLPYKGNKCVHLIYKKQPTPCHTLFFVTSAKETHAKKHCRLAADRSCHTRSGVALKIETPISVWMPELMKTHNCA